MEVERISHKKIGIIHTVPIYYRCNVFVSEKIGEIKVRDMYKEVDGKLSKCGYKHKFLCSLSVKFGFKKKNIFVNIINKNFEFEEKRLNLAVTENFFFDIDEKKSREYKIDKLLEYEA